jgi:hypothetical protein
MPAIRLECSYDLNADYYGASVGSPKVKTCVYVIWWCGTEYGIVTKCLFWCTAPFEACYSYARRNVSGSYVI